MDAQKIKNDIVAQYDLEAEQKDNKAWYDKGNSARVPENKASRYFIDRKVGEALALCRSDISERSSACEIGCSFGHMTSLLAKKFENLTAVDISPASIRLAKNRMKRYGITSVRFITDDAESLTKLCDNSFDVVFSFSTIRFCPNPGLALKTICAKLRPGGIAVIDFPNRYSPWHIFVKAVAGIKKHAHDNLYTPGRIAQLFDNAGLKVEKIRHFLFTTKRLPSIMLPAFMLADAVLERTPVLSRLAGIIMVKGRKE
jgi:SAM-dependent methyltransferase